MSWVKFPRVHWYLVWVAVDTGNTRPALQRRLPVSGEWVRALAWNAEIRFFREIRELPSRAGVKNCQQTRGSVCWCSAGASVLSTGHFGTQLGRRLIQQALCPALALLFWLPEPLLFSLPFCLYHLNSLAGTVPVAALFPDRPSPVFPGACRPTHTPTESSPSSFALRSSALAFPILSEALCL